jgi:adenylate kinase family enzyme
MKEEFNFAHYSTGDLLREEVARGGPLSAEIKEL